MESPFYMEIIMNIKSLLIIPVIVLTWATYACAEGTSLKIMSHDDVYSLVKQYEEEGLKEYKNFDDFYLVMKKNGYPNLSFGETASKMKGLNFKNPQSMSTYRTLREEKNEATRKVKAKQYEPWRPLSEKEEQEKQIRTEKMIREVANFTKNGYYSFYKNIFETTDALSVRICFNIDIVALGFVGQMREFIPYKEEKKIIAKEISSLVPTLNLGDSENLLLSIFDPTVSCHALISLTETGLDKLYAEASVASILPPVRALPGTFKTL